MSTSISQSSERSDSTPHLRGHSEDSRPPRDPSSASSCVRSQIAADLQLDLTCARPGDHPSIFHFLTTIFHTPSSQEFQFQLEDPYYEPSDRLVVKQSDRVISHLRMTNRAIQFGSETIPVTTISDVATLPEFRGQGCASALLATAEETTVSAGSVVSFLRTSVPQFYKQHGWTVCGRHSFSTGRPRDILSYLSATSAARETDASETVSNLIELDASKKELNIRLWRHVERAALIRLYSENIGGMYGPIVRSEQYWRWLISRRAYDRIYVAIEGPDKLELDDELAPIVGYAATLEGRIVELMVSPEHPNVASSLLARACGDAIERDYHVVRFDGPPNDPLHQTIELAGGKHNYHEAENGEVFMAKIHDPIGFLNSLCPKLHARAKAAELSRPCELGLVIGDEKFRLVISRRSVKLVDGKLCRSYITCTSSQLTQMMLGHTKMQEAVDSGRIEASTRVAVETASALFPCLPFWRPPMDELPA